MKLNQNLKLVFCIEDFKFLLKKIYIEKINNLFISFSCFQFKEC